MVSDGNGDIEVRIETVGAPASVTKVNASDEKLDDKAVGMNGRGYDLIPSRKLLFLTESSKSSVVSSYSSSSSHDSEMIFDMTDKNFKTLASSLLIYCNPYMQYEMSFADHPLAGNLDMYEVILVMWRETTDTLVFFHSLAERYMRVAMLA